MSIASDSSALDASPTARISIQWPSSMMSISVASSQKNGMPSRPSTVAAL